MNDKTMGISFRRKDQLSADVILNVWEKVTQCNSCFNTLDTLVLEVHTVKKPVGFGGIKTKGRPLAILAHLKKNTVQVKAKTNCVAHTLIIAITQIAVIQIISYIAMERN